MPMHRAGPETQQDPIRFKDLVREAEERLYSLSLHAPEVKKLMEPAESILPHIQFPHHRSDGLAMFCSEEVFHYFLLPLTFKESVVVAHRFHVRPLLPLFSGDGRYYVLALSQNEVRLLQGSHFSISEIDLSDMPESLAQTLRDDDSWKNLSMRANPSGGEGNLKSVFYGEKKDFKKDILRYFRRIDRGISDLLKDEHAPLVLAGVEYLHPLYKEVNSHPHLADVGIAGNPEQLSVEKLHERAWAIVGPYFQKTQQEAMAHYRQNAGTRRASTNLQEIVPAAYHGKIEMMFVDIESRQWGTFDSTTDEVNLHKEEKPADEDLMEFATVHALLKKGIVYTIEPGEMPERGPVAAVFRHS
jgi:hypothetical protein